jgi:hypothetical protein
MMLKRSEELKIPEPATVAGVGDGMGSGVGIGLAAWGMTIATTAIRSIT